MDRNKQKTVARKRRKTGIRKKAFGSATKPRLTIFRSSKHTYAQLVNDFDGNTIVSSSTVQEKLAKGGDVDAAKAVGTKIAERAKAAGIEMVTFDRNGFKYHGRVKALADAARAGGLKF